MRVPSPPPTSLHQALLATMRHPKPPSGPLKRLPVPPGTPPFGTAGYGYVGSAGTTYRPPGSRPPLLKVPRKP